MGINFALVHNSKELFKEKFLPFGYKWRGICQGEVFLFV